MVEDFEEITVNDTLIKPTTCQINTFTEKKKLLKN